MNYGLQKLGPAFITTMGFWDISYPKFLVPVFSTISYQYEVASGDGRQYRLYEMNGGSFPADT